MYTRSLGMAQSTHEFVPVVSQSSSLSGNQPVAQIPVLAQSNNAFPVGIQTNQPFSTMVPQFVPSLIQPLQHHAYPISGVLPPNYTAQIICDIRRSPYAQQYNDLSSAVTSPTTAIVEIARKYNMEKDTLDFLVQQLEFYMSPANLPTDLFLLKQMDDNQHVPISCFCNFPKVKELLPQMSLEERTDVVTLLLKISPMVQLNREETKVRVNRDMVVFMDTLELRGLPENVQHHEMKSLFPTSESLEFNVQEEVWVVSFKDSPEAMEKYRSITNKTLKFRQNILYVRFKTRGRNPSIDESQMHGLFYVKSNPDWTGDAVPAATLQRHHASQLYQATQTSSALFPGQQQQQLATYNLQQQQCLRHYVISPLIFPTNIMPTYILPQPSGIFNIQHHTHPTLSHSIPQSLSVAPPSVALAAPSLSSPQGHGQFGPTVHQGGNVIHHQQQQPHHHQHPNAALYSGNNGSIAAAGRGNGQRRPPRGGRRGGQNQRNRLPPHGSHEDPSEFKVPHPVSEATSTMVHVTQK